MCLDVPCAALYAQCGRGPPQALERDRPWRACTRLPMSRTRRQATLKVGTDCAGIMGATLALEKLGLKRKIRHVFVSEKERYVRDIISTNFPEAASCIIPDVMERDNSTTPTCDIYTAGFPCQPFSGQGKRQGEQDGAGRGIVAYKLVDYIGKQLPRASLGSRNAHSGWPIQSLDALGAIHARLFT